MTREDLIALEARIREALAVGGSRVAYREDGVGIERVPRPGRAIWLVTEGARQTECRDQWQAVSTFLWMAWTKSRPRSLG